MEDTCGSCGCATRRCECITADDLAYQDKAELLALEIELASVLSWIPPAQRASFNARITAVLMAMHHVVQADRDAQPYSATILILRRWREERERINQRTGGRP